jgi:MscS family membrane protein
MGWLLVWAIWASAQTTNPSVVAGSAQAQEAAVAANKTAAAAVVSMGQANQGFLTFGLDRISWLQAPLFGNPRWKFLASLIYLVLAFYVSKLLDYLIQVRLKKWAARTETKLDDMLLELVHGPIKVVSFVILLHIGLEIFSWPQWVQTYLSKGLQVVVAVSLTYVLLKATDMLMNYWRDRASGESDKFFNEQIFTVVRKTVKAVIVVTAVLVTSQNLGIPITGMLALGSVGGLAVGLAAQDTLANLFGAVAIFMDKPFRVGDHVQVESIDGTVESIGLRSTRIRNLDGHLVTVPNKTMGNAIITNIDRRPSIKTVMNIGVTYDTSNEKLQEALAILDDIIRQHPKTQDVTITFNKFGDSALNIQVVHWWNSTNNQEYLDGIQQFNLLIKQRFEQARIEMAFPTQTVYLKPEEGGRAMEPGKTSYSDS